MFLVKCNSQKQGCGLRLRIHDSTIQCKVAELKLRLTKKIVSSGVQCLDFMQHQPFKSFTHYCYY